MKKDKLTQVILDNSSVKGLNTIGKERVLVTPLYLAQAIRAAGFIHKDEIEWPEESTSKNSSGINPDVIYGWNRCLKFCKQSVERAR